MLRLGAVELERGSNIAGHRGYYLTGPGVRLNQVNFTILPSFRSFSYYSRLSSIMVWIS